MAAGLTDSLLALAFLGILLLAAKLGEEAFRKLGLIPFVGAILAGTLLGPGVFDVIQPIPTISLFIGLGINFLLFVGGAEEFESAKVTSIFGRKAALSVSLLQFAIRFGGVTLVSYLLFRQFLPAVVIGIVAGMSSAGPLSRLLTDTGMARTDEGSAIFSQVVVIEVAAVILFSFVYDLAGKTITPLAVALVAVELVLAVASIVVFGRYIFVRLLTAVEKRFQSREAEFAVIISVLLIAGFVGQATGFNSAIVALFLGLLLQPFLAVRPVLLEKIRAFTYGFFEPLFFAGLGLYFVVITPGLVADGFVIFIAALILDGSVGAASSRFFKVDAWKNAFGTCVNGGVDAALLVSALTAGTALIQGFAYSATAIGIALLSMIAPLLFRLRVPLVSLDPDSRVRKIVEQQLETITAVEISKSLPTVAVNMDEAATHAIEVCVRLDARAAVVLDDRGRPVATFVLRDVMGLGKRELARMKVSEAPLEEPLIVDRSQTTLALSALFRETNMPIAAVVDEKGILEGTILEREILRRIVSSFTTEPHGDENDAQQGSPP